MASMRRTLSAGVAHRECKRPTKLVDVRAQTLRTRVRFPASPLAIDEPLDMPVERFLSMLRFEQRDKLAELPIDIAQLSVRAMLEAQESR